MPSRRRQPLLAVLAIALPVLLGGFAVTGEDITEVLVERLDVARGQVP